MSEVTAAAAPRKSKTSKTILQMALGGVSGGVAMYGLLTLLDAKSGLIDQPDRMVALGVALVYALSGALVLLGVAAPKIGGKTLNVEDEGELAEQRPQLFVGGFSFLLVGVLLGALAIAPGEGIGRSLDATTARLIAGAAFVISTIVWLRYRNMGDEMMRLMQSEVNNLTLFVLFLGLGAWAGLAHLDLVAAPSPLSLITTLYAVYLIAAFVVVGRRGMLATR